MDQATYFQKHKKRIVNCAIGSSSMRGQGKKNMIQSFRDLAYETDLQAFKKSLSSKESYLEYLDHQTISILEKLSEPFDVQWGAIRKGLNIVYRDVFYSAFMAASLNLTKSEMSFLEVPLDSFTGKGIIEDYNKISTTNLSWHSIRKLTPSMSAELQSYARQIAKEIHGINEPVELDLIYWRRDADEQD